MDESELRCSLARNNREMDCISASGPSHQVLLVSKPFSMR